MEEKIARTKNERTAFSIPRDEARRIAADIAKQRAAIAVGALRESKQLREPASEQHHPRKIDEPCGKGDPSGHIWRQRATARVSMVFQRRPFVDIDVDQR